MTRGVPRRSLIRSLRDLDEHDATKSPTFRLLHARYVCLFCFGQTELPRWVGETAKAPRLVEVEPTVCEGLVSFCLAEAQQMAIGKVRVFYFSTLNNFPALKLVVLLSLFGV